MTVDSTRRMARLAIAAVPLLALVDVLWETAWAPLRPGSYSLALKALPLAVLLPGLARGNRRARQWLALLLPFYVAEGVVRAFSEPGRHALVAAAAGLVATVAFLAVLGWFRAERTAN